MQLLEEQRETWGTRGGFVLAAVGSAVGLGNLWGFPYKLYSYGGGAFLIPYITAMFCIGIPLLILEFSLGHFTQRAAPGAYARCNRKLEFVGWWGIILGFVIITYYPVILAYCFSFMWESIVGIFNGGELPWAGEGIEGVQNAKDYFYKDYLHMTEGFKLGSIQWHIVLTMFITWVAMYFCIFKGVKLVGKIVWITVPLPWIMLLILAVRGLTLEGSMDGLVYYLDPVWSELLKPTTWRFAFGQVFFSLSLSYGVMVTYASFLHRKSDINNNAAIIGLADFATSFIAGIAIFATIGGMAYVTSQAGNAVGVQDVVDKGPGLAFVAFPYALAQLPGSAWWSFVFFFTLVTLGIDSGFSITESVLAGIVDKTGWRRAVVLPVMSLVGFSLGLFYVTNGGLNWLATIDDFVNGTWGIAFLGLLECLVLGWVYRIDRLRVHANERSDWKLGKWWNLAIRVFIPIVLGTLFMWSLFTDYDNIKSFIANNDLEKLFSYKIGYLVIACAPVLAIAMSLIKSPLRQRSSQTIVSPSPEASIKLGRVAALFALVATGAFVLAAVFFSDTNGPIIPALFIVQLVCGVLAVIISNYLMQKDYGQRGVSWLGRTAGIVAIFNISAALAVILLNVTTNAAANIEKLQHVPGDKLSGVSYMILAVVFLLIVGGLGWCFYRAIMAGAKDAPIQTSEESEQL